MRSNATHNPTLHAAPAAHDVVGEALALPSALLASVSHDLRNPLSVILGASEVLHDGFANLTDEDRHAYLRAIRRECVRMDEYVQGVYHVTRLLIGGSARLVRDWNRVEALVASAVERLLRYREDARVTVDMDAPLRPVFVHGALVEQALLNVLDNAAKFSPPGVAVQLRVRQEASGRTQIEVVDAGPGIPTDQRERVFGLFVSDDPLSRGRAGSGLGLAISRGIMRAHGGDVIAQPRQDGPTGAWLRLTLPAAEADEAGAR